MTWLTPVESGDTFSIETEILDTRPSESDLKRGIVPEEITVINQRNETVLSFENYELVSRRNQPYYVNPLFQSAAKYKTTTTQVDFSPEFSSYR